MKRMKALIILFMAAVLCSCHSNHAVDDSEVEAPKEIEVSAFAGASECSRFANDSAVYIEAENGNIQQWSFDGVFQDQFCVMKEEVDKLEFSEILSVENDKIVYERTNWETEKDEIMQIPIQENEDGQYLDVDHQTLLLEIEIGNIGYNDSCGTPVFFYINEDYIIYLRDHYSEGGMVVYSLKEGREVEIKNLPKKKKNAEYPIYWFTEAMTSVKSQVCGDQIIFNTEPIGDKKCGAPYGFSIYRLGEDHVEIIDERCYTAAAYIADQERQKVYYQIETDQSIWEYDCESGEKREMISEREFRECYEAAGLTWQENEDDDSMFLQGETLYIIRSKSNIKDAKIVSYDLKGKQDLHYEQKVTQKLEQWGQLVEWNEDAVSDGTLTILLGKLIYFTDFSDEAYFCIDLSTAEGMEIIKEDKESIYYMMVAGIKLDASEYHALDEAKQNREETAEAEKAAARQKEFLQNEKKVAKLSVEEQLTQLAQKMAKQYQKWDDAGREEWCYGVYYTVTDLDHNGVPELILSTGSQGSGGFTTTAIYEAGAEGKAVTIQTPITMDDIVEIAVTGDILNPIDTAYYDAEKDIWYYVTSDYVSGGYEAKGHGDNVWLVKAGESKSKNICGYYDNTDHKSKQYKTTYYKVVGEDEQEIAKSEYDVDKIMEEYFTDCRKYCVSISWGKMKRETLLSADQSMIYQKLRESYHAFETTERRME